LLTGFSLLFRSFHPKPAGLSKSPLTAKDRGKLLDWKGRVKEKMNVFYNSYPGGVSSP
jgi:hypothetical protein